MPNHVSNFVSFKDTPIELQKKIIKENFNKQNEFDFNKIIPMPKELDIEESSDTEMGMVIVSNDLKHCSYLTIEELKNRFEQRTKEQQEKILSLGKQALSNIEKYGCKSWYDFACDKWGTKWNAYSSYIENVSNNNFEESLMNLRNDITFSFQTAWSTPLPIFEALSKKYPEATFYIEYADEDMGNNCGYFEIKNGEALDYNNDKTDSSENWNEFAFHLLYGEDADREEHGFDSNYEYSEEVIENYYKKQEIKNKLENFD